MCMCAHADALIYGMCIRVYISVCIGREVKFSVAQMCLSNYYGCIQCVAFRMVLGVSSFLFSMNNAFAWWMLTVVTISKTQ